MYSKKLREQLTQTSKAFALTNGLTFNSGLTPAKLPKDAILFDNPEGNFHPNSWGVIKKNSNHFSRTQKAHSKFDGEDSRLEMQSSNSSDALLMNIFCHSQINNWKGLKDLLQIDTLENLSFGYFPGVKLIGNQVDKTEVDLFIKSGNKEILCESKLTETDFVFVPKSRIVRYLNAEMVFNLDNLPTYKGEIANYQLIRNILAAYESNRYFYLFVDARRPDLAKSFFETVRCIKSNELQMRCNIIYWQDIAAVVGKDLSEFLSAKYGI